MSFLFRSRPRTPQELVKATKDAILKLSECLGENSLSAIMGVPVVNGQGTVGPSATQGSTVPANVDKKAVEKVNNIFIAVS